MLGVFGRDGRHLATCWGNSAGNGKLPAYTRAPFQLYRNYDGKGGAFGDSAVKVTSSDGVRSSVYAASDSRRPGRLTVLVINKELRTAFNGQIAIDRDPKNDRNNDRNNPTYSKAEVYSLDGSTAAIRRLPDIDIKNNRIAARLPALSATLFVCAPK